MDEVDEDWMSARPPPKKKSSSWSFSPIGFLKNNLLMLLVFAAVVLYQTKVFGYFSADAISQRKQEAAASRMQFGTWQKRVLKDANGPAVTLGSWVTMNVNGYAEDGRPFWNSKRDRSPTFQAGVGKMIKGIDEAIMGMAQGQKARVTVAPDMAFGERGKSSWNIGAWEVLVFEIEILKVSNTPPEKSEPAPVRREEIPQEEEEEDEDELMQPLTKGAQSHSTSAPSQKQKPPAEKSELDELLDELSLSKFAPALKGLGLVTLDDLKMIEDASELPDSMPLFSRKKLAAHASKLRGAKESEGKKTQDKEAAEKKAKDEKVVEPDISVGDCDASQGGECGGTTK